MPLLIIGIMRASRTPQVVRGLENDAGSTEAMRTMVSSSQHWKLCGFSIAIWMLPDIKG